MRARDTASHLIDTRRKRAIRTLTDRLAPDRERWIARNAFFHDEDLRYLEFLVPAGRDVLDLGCGIGRTLAGLAPKRGVGVDFSEATIEVARAAHPDIEFVCGDIEDPATLATLEGPFDVVLIADTLAALEDCQALLEGLHRLCHAETRVVIANSSPLWEPVLVLAEEFGLRMPQVEQNWLTDRGLANLLDLADFEVVSSEHRQLVPKRLGGVGEVVNRYIGTLPFVEALGLRSYTVARPKPTVGPPPSVSIIVPCRNEAGNIVGAIERTPQFCDDIEFVFVEGHSTDGTYEEVERVIAAYPDLDVKVTRQHGVGKADAVRKGFDLARGDVLMILDADLTMPPEDLPKFYEAIREGRGDLVMGTRLVYPMEDDAMRFLNMWGNKVFSWLFTWLLNQPITDTLCGTKVLRREDWARIQAGREYFGDFDPFGDFDMIFGAAKLNFKILEIPVRYRARVYGTTQISRFRHGLLLAKMVVVAHRKFKAV